MKEGEGITLQQDEYDGNELREDYYEVKAARAVKAGHGAKYERTAGFLVDGVATSGIVEGMKVVDFDDAIKYPSQMKKFEMPQFRCNMT